jgi:hypothetical protein
MNLPLSVLSFPPVKHSALQVIVWLSVQRLDKFNKSYKSNIYIFFPPSGNPACKKRETGGAVSVVAGWLAGWRVA